MQTEAVVFSDPREVTFDVIECRDPGPDDVVVETHFSWISNGTEGSYLRGERSDGDTPFADGDPSPFPVVAGYQRVGVVEAVGENVQGLRIGQSVFATIGHVLGMHHDYGGQLKRSVSAASEVFPIPEGDDPIRYAGLVLAQVGWNSGCRPSVTPGDIAVVVGDGLVGQWTAQTLSSRGAEVVLVGRHDDRLALFADWPRAHTVNEHKQSLADALEKLRAARPGSAVRIGVDTVGSLDVMTELSSTLDRFGDLVSAGFYGPADAFPLQPARYGEHTIHLVSGWTRERLEQTLNAVATGVLKTEPLITHRFDARDAAEAWTLIEGKTEPVLGVILDWTTI